jgi:hypothetical protein
MAFTQLRNADGACTGNLGITCSICRSGRIGTAADAPTLGAQYGTNGLSDLSSLYRDLGGLSGIFSVIQRNRFGGREISPPFTPRYVNDSAFLETLLHEGIAAHVAAKTVINSDSARVDGETDAVADAPKTNWFSYRDRSVRFSAKRSSRTPRATSLLVYDTRNYSQSNTGHEFTDILTDPECQAWSI